MIMFLFAVMCLVTAPAFALVDGEIYGGRTFSGSYESGSSSVDLKGWDYGARVHLTSSGFILSTGFGLFFQRAPLNYDVMNRTYDVSKVNIGPDAFARLEIIPVLKPYVRAGVSAYEYLDADGAKTEKKYFNSYYYGAGIGIAAPTPVLSLMIFAEYLNNRRFYGDKLTLHTVNAGVSVGI